MNTLVMKELTKTLFGDDCNDEMDVFIKKFWGIVNKDYDYRDMLTFEEIHEIFDRIKENIENQNEV